MKILIIEDERIISEALKSGLEKSGYVVDCLSDGEKAEKRIIFNAEKYDLIILDWFLPSKDGLELCKSVRKLKMKGPQVRDPRYQFSSTSSVLIKQCRLLKV